MESTTDLIRNMCYACKMSLNAMTTQLCDSLSLEMLYHVWMTPMRLTSEDYALYSDSESTPEEEEKCALERTIENGMTEHVHRFLMKTLPLTRNLDDIPHSDHSDHSETMRKCIDLARFKGYDNIANFMQAILGGYNNGIRNYILDVLGVDPNRESEVEELPYEVPNEETGEKGSGHDCCVICQEYRKNVVILPCAHLCSCVNCIREYASQGGSDCPVCKSVIERTIKVYM